MPEKHGGIAQHRRLTWFAVIGLICTAAFAAAYTLLRRALGPIEANVVALSLTIGINFLANRRYTFEASEGRIHRQLPGYVVVYLAGLGASSAVLAVLLKLTGTQPGWIETIIALGAGCAATVVRYVLLSVWVFRAPATVKRPTRPGVASRLTLEEPNG